jgi:hypothetical protein
VNGNARPALNQVVSSANQVATSDGKSGAIQLFLLGPPVAALDQGRTDRMTSLRTRLLRLTLAMVVWGAVWSCNAPFIPVPPPSQTGFMSSLGSDGNGGQKTVWAAIGEAGSVPAAARVFVFNLTTSSGVITQAASDGSFRSQTFDGTAGDRIDISAEGGNGEQSPTSCLLLQDAQPAPSCPPP